MLKNKQVLILLWGMQSNERGSEVKIKLIQALDNEKLLHFNSLTTEWKRKKFFFVPVHKRWLMSGEEIAPALYFEENSGKKSPNFGFDTFFIANKSS